MSRKEVFPYTYILGCKIIFTLNLMNFWPFCNILHGLSFCKLVITLTPILRITNYITCKFNATIWKTLEHKTEKHKLCSWQPIFCYFWGKGVTELTTGSGASNCSHIIHGIPVFCKRAILAAQKAYLLPPSP